MLNPETVQPLTGRREFILICREDESGETGWCLDDLSTDIDIAVTRDPYLIAHDIIEHVNETTDIGGMGEELQAMGGVWLTRGTHCDITRNNIRGNNDPHSNVAADIGRMWEDFMNGRDFDCDIPELLECGYEEDIAEIFDEACEWHLHRQMDTYDESDRDVEDFRSPAIALMCHGILVHERLYSSHQFKANNLFYNIVNCFKSGELPYAEEYSQEIIKIVVDFDTEVVTIDHQEFDYDEYVDEDETLLEYA